LYIQKKLLKLSHILFIRVQWYCLIEVTHAYYHAVFFKYNHSQNRRIKIIVQNAL